MKAMRLEKPGNIEQNPLQWQELPAPDPKPKEVRITVNVCGVCHTDLHTVEGDLDLPRLPITPGHQIVGRINMVGKGVKRFQPGQRVGVAWLNSTCGVCDFCRNGQENLCPEAKFTGLHRDGGYGEQVLVDEQFAFELPPNLTDEEASPLLCAGIIGYRSLRLSGILPGGRLGLYGFGASAHLAIQVARYWDCKVYVFTRGTEHQQHALELGAEWVGQAQETPPKPLDAGITFAPAGWIVPLALEHLCPGGTLAINAIHMSPIPQFDYEKIYGERSIRSVANFTRQDALEFLELAAQIPIHTNIEIFPLSEANLVLQSLKASQIRGAAVLKHNMDI
ncbi:MAG: zinc-dependent alcohol dehydrogenase family protein [Candidatus Promineifilaceae bacterium]|jgi:propanol-preferring alcohol dehydrogenase